ncbi:farnesyl-pyrophosphate synthetase [Aspergillus eucalypticola CBS 122712]|uniref:Farnesyl-pyrophosphate synthetase n=1 Tax=Aspergillus eucalypticola (strain CBS 122712 / IBT 29274) TaxID=1448314 RepID=A0A317VEB4_ASPEC|nr:farnesyl-pyrophosphate synthetase [Aspergillus eucalypticola CBS 122712]PWY72703.1 farnesyl-pyrophosphate synthetase [Aspergillus eucalypticola CBS 122712]
MAFTVDRSKFDPVLAELVGNVKEHFGSNGASGEVINHVEKNLRNGKMFRALSVPQTGLSTLDRPITEQELHDLSILGWLVEVLQAYILILDDIMDNSLTRRGKLCWYRRTSVGMKAVNDGCLLKSSISILLKQHFPKHPAYLKAMETLHEFAFLTEIGQECDGIASDNRGTEQWNMAEYDNIQTRDILVPLGSFYQFQNEYLVIFGNHRLTGKIGTDIQENKCSWVIIQALQMCSTEQRHILLENYGQPSQDSAMKCQRIFELLSLREEYRSREDRELDELEASICNLDESEGVKKRHS